VNFGLSIQLESYGITDS